MKWESCSSTSITGLVHRNIYRKSRYFMEKTHVFFQDRFSFEPIRWSQAQVSSEMHPASMLVTCYHDISQIFRCTCFFLNTPPKDVMVQFVTDKHRVFPSVSQISLFRSVLFLGVFSVAPFCRPVLQVWSSSAKGKRSGSGVETDLHRRLEAQLQGSPRSNVPGATSCCGFAAWHRLEKHRKTIGKTMGKWWFNGVLWDLPSVNLT